MSVQQTDGISEKVYTPHTGGFDPAGVRKGVDNDLGEGFVAKKAVGQADGVE